MKRIILASIFGVLFSLNSSQAITNKPIPEWTDPAPLVDMPSRSQILVEKFSNELKNIFASFINNENAAAILISVAIIIILIVGVIYIRRNKKI